MTTCGEATINLLAEYGVSTVFGVPGVHTLDFCRSLTDVADGRIRHVQVRNEQGAGFAAEGWARATGRPGVALVISGPGVTNAATALGQCYADSLPMLLISAEAASETIGKGWGVLHEVTEQKKVTEPLTALSATARRAADVPELLAQAFSIFASERPRPVHISIPIDVQAELVAEPWRAVTLPRRPVHAPELIAEAADMLRNAQRPLILTGGGAVDADIKGVAEKLGAVVIASTAGKGVIADDHPLSLNASTVRPEARFVLADADVILAVGTEMSETDSFVERMEVNGALIRVDIDPRKMNDFYPATLAIVADAAPVITALSNALDGHGGAKTRIAAEARVSAARVEIMGALSPSEQRHVRFLDLLASAAPANTVYSGDACQLVYTGAFAFQVAAPRRWFYPAGFCALGNALPNAIGAKMALPDQPVIALAGDGGFMFTVQELITAAELGLNLPIIIWENGGLKQIQDDMDSRQIPRVGVEGMNPDFQMLAAAFHANSARPASAEAFSAALTDALGADRPTLIIIEERADWLSE